MNMDFFYDEETQLAIVLAISKAEAEENARKQQANRQIRINGQLATSSSSSLAAVPIEETGIYWFGEQSENVLPNTNINQDNLECGRNLFVSNLDDTIDNRRLCEEFSPFGTIVSSKVVVTQYNRSKGYGFVCFSTAEEANHAMTAMNGRIIGSKVLNVVLSDKQGISLYVKNLDGEVDDQRLRTAFSPFGRIVSARVIKRNNRSRGFGYVSFSTSEEASMAISHMNGQLLGSKCLYVALARNKAAPTLRTGYQTSDAEPPSSLATSGTSPESSEKYICKICLDKEFSHILDCRHVLCESCAMAVFDNVAHSTCPFCRKEVTSRPNPIHF